jgi:hypothetical protein
MVNGFTETAPHVICGTGSICAFFLWVWLYLKQIPDTRAFYPEIVPSVP